MWGKVWKCEGEERKAVTYRGQFNYQLVLVCFIQPVIFYGGKNGKYIELALKRV